MDVDTFMRQGLVDAASKKPKIRRNIKGKASAKLKSKRDEHKLQNEGDKVENLKESGSSGVKQHKNVIGSLAEKDPEFFKFLLDEDRNLLNFEESSDDEGEIEDLDIHKPPRKLVSADDEDDSDSSSQSDEDKSKSAKAKPKKSSTQQVIVTSQLAEKWSSQLSSKPSLMTAEKLVKAFQSAVAEAAQEESSSAPTNYKVEGIAHFNAVVRACLRNFPQVFTLLLQYKDNKNELPNKCKKWGYVSPVVKSYLSALSMLLKNLAAPDVVNAVLKHVSQLINYIACFPKHTRVFMKTLTHLWSTGEETSRVLAFLSINRLVRLKKEDLLEKALKSMYMAYIRNCKFCSVTLLPMISFMQHSLVEIFSMDSMLGYQYTFVYIRQLAIHLRNAMASNKKESHQSVYNWQFIHSCKFFARVVSSLHTDENISQLLYPLVQIIIGVIRLVPTAKFFPLRFHCIRMLNLISQKTDVFLPTMNLMLEVTEIADLQKRVTGSSNKPIDFSVVLKLSKPQTHNKVFMDGVMDEIYELMLDHLACYSHTVSFPEMVIPAVIQLKSLIKSSRNPNFTKIFKQLLSKIEESRKLIEARRNAEPIDISDKKCVSAWEKKMKSEGTPLQAYYKQYRSVRDREVQLEITGKERMEAQDNTPVIPTGQKRATEKERQEFSSLFESDSDSEDSDGDESRFAVNKKVNKRKRKAEDDAVNSDDDDASSLNSEELALLDKDAEEEEAENELVDGEVQSDSDAEDDDGENESDMEEDEDDDDDYQGKDDIVEDLELSD